MSITHIDFNSFRGRAASADSSAFVALNPNARPGSLAFGAAVAAKGGIGSQVACRLSLEHFVDGVLGYFDRRNSGPVASEHTETSLQVLESAFKRANSSVYEFGHKLAAGGRMAAALLGVVVEEDVVATGRVGPGSVYLFRGGELFSFFEQKKNDPASGATRPGAELVGANSLVAVELASIPARPEDIVVILSGYLSEAREKKLSEYLASLKPDSALRAAEVCQAVELDGDELPFACFARIGPETIYLQQTV